MKQALASLLLVACTRPEITPASSTSPAPAPGPSHPAPAAPNVVAAKAEVQAIHSCQGVGPRACAVSPSDAGGLCAQVARCLVGWFVGGEDSEYPTKVTSVTSCAPLQLTTPAAPETGVVSTSILGVEGTLQDEPSNAWLLVAQYADGYCVVDSAIDPEWPHGGYLSADFTLTWASPSRLEMFAHVASHESMDQEELEDIDPSQGGEDGIDVSDQTCSHLSYEVKAGRFVRVHEESTDEPCEQNRGAPRFTL